MRGGNQGDVQRDDDQMQIDTIDWQDFVVVDKIDLYEDEEMRDANDAEEQDKLKEQERLALMVRQQIEENQQILTMPPPSMVAGMQQSVQGATETVINSALDPEMKIRKNYQKKADEKKQTDTQKCPKCQQEILITEWKEHMRLELMDPKHRENKLKMEERKNLNSLASGEEIS